MNYDELVSTVSSYTENEFPEGALDNFIVQAETRIYNTVQIPALRRNVTGTVTAENRFLACPQDFLATYSLAIISSTGEYSFLLNKDVSFIREAYPNPATLGAPKYYALFGPQSTDPTNLTFVMGPTPATAYSAELNYFYYPQSITTVDTGQTWLGDNFSPVLLYGTLVEANTFMKGEADITQLYVAKYTEAMQQLKRLGDGLDRSDAYRTVQARVTVL